MPLQIAHHYGSPRQPVKAAQQFDDPRIAEMVQEQTRYHIIEALPAKRKRKSVCQNLRLRRRRKIRGAVIKAGHARPRIQTADQLCRIARRRPHIQNRERIANSRYPRERSLDDRVPPEISIDAHQIRQIRPRFFRVQMIEQFRFNPPLRKQALSLTSLTNLAHASAPINETIGAR